MAARSKIEKNIKKINGVSPYKMQAQEKQKLGSD